MYEENEKTLTLTDNAAAIVGYTKENELSTQGADYWWFAQPSDDVSVDVVQRREGSIIKTIALLDVKSPGQHDVVFECRPLAGRSTPSEILELTVNASRPAGAPLKLPAERSIFNWAA